MPCRPWSTANRRLSPRCRGRCDAYVNELPEPGDDQQLRDIYGRDKYERLARVKGDYDPGNVFNSNTNTNIKPS